MRQWPELVGFWEYTSPGGGSCDRYSIDDWKRLLDEAAAGGMNGLVLGIKWLTTGYRSRLPWLDQDKNCTAIADDNRTLHKLLDESKERGISVWLLVVATQMRSSAFGVTPSLPSGMGSDFGSYDLDQPEMIERIPLLFGEVAELFGRQSAGIIAEVEFCDHDAPHRAAPYGAWARANNRPSWDDIHNIRLEPRSYPFFHWRDYTTYRRIETYRAIEDAVRAADFCGGLATIAEVDNGPGWLVRNMNLDMLRAELPSWQLVTYDSIYDRRRNRAATVEFCLGQPRRLGFTTHFVTRGVMTFNWPLDAPGFPLREQWEMELADVAAEPPDALWFMGADAVGDGPVCSAVKLPGWGFHDAKTARRELIAMTRAAAGKA